MAAANPPPNRGRGGRGAALLEYAANPPRRPGETKSSSQNPASTATSITDHNRVSMSNVCSLFARPMKWLVPLDCSHHCLCRVWLVLIFTLRFLSLCSVNWSWNPGQGNDSQTGNFSAQGRTSTSGHFSNQAFRSFGFVLSASRPFVFTGYHIFWLKVHVPRMQERQIEGKKTVVSVHRRGDKFWLHPLQVAEFSEGALR